MQKTITSGRVDILPSFEEWLEDDLFPYSFCALSFQTNLQRNLDIISLEKKIYPMQAV